MLTPDDVRAIMDKVEAEFQRHRWLPGTVTQTANVQDEYQGVAQVMLDGPGAQPIQVTNLLVEPVYTGDRVMVIFDPPQGAYIIGRMTQLVPQAGRLTCAQLLQPDDLSDYHVGWTCEAYLSGGVTHDSTSLLAGVAGIYATSCSVFVGPATGTYIQIVTSDTGLIVGSGYAPVNGFGVVAVQAYPLVQDQGVQVLVNGSVPSSSNVVGHFDLVRVDDLPADSELDCNCGGG